jgi:lysyl endopeptidase
LKNRTIYIVCIVFWFLVFVEQTGYGQISHGGFPLEVTSLKSASFQEKIVRMPHLVQEQLQLEKSQHDQLKSLKFAHSFQVSLNPENSGSWFDVDGFNVWQLVIKSDSAFSLNVIFSKFYIPEGARLFVYNPEKTFVLGAFTSFNNKEYKKLAVYPVPGDELIIQYEEPENAAFNGELEVGEINHDYTGILGLKNRWDRRPSEECEIDVNCEFDSGLENEKHSVCRIFAGDELGTGTLVNNVLNDGKPYLLSAFHVFDDPENANTTIYDFNYESPFCTGLDGSDIQSVSGSTALAWFDSLDFILVELSETPPATYLPYYAGWDASHVKPNNSHIIHHPNGDVKKISYDSGYCDSIRYSDRYLNYGHWKVLNWEQGTTEGGSSGGPLFNNEKHLVGTLSGGNASCDELSYDLFARLDKMWNYKSQNNRQLKRWLDPGGTGTSQIDGLNPYEASSSTCSFICNFQVEDSIVLLPKYKGADGIYTGNNSLNITEFSERFTGIDKAVISGVAIGVADFKGVTESPMLTVRIYAGDTIPDFAVKQFKFPFSQLTKGAMNFLSFNQSVSVEGNFFISIVVPTEDSLAIYQSDFRPLVEENSMQIKQDGYWKMASDMVSEQTSGASLLVQALVCSATFAQDVDTVFDSDQLFRLYPNPTNEYVVVEFKDRSSSLKISMSDMTGKVVYSSSFENKMYTEIDVSGISPGIYILKASKGNCIDTQKVVISGH